MSDGDPRRRLSDTNIGNQSLRMTTWLDRPRAEKPNSSLTSYSSPPGDAGLGLVVTIIAGIGIPVFLLYLLINWIVEKTAQLSLSVGFLLFGFFIIPAMLVPIPAILGAAAIFVLIAIAEYNLWHPSDWTLGWALLLLYGPFFVLTSRFLPIEATLKSKLYTITLALWQMYLSSVATFGISMRLPDLLNRKFLYESPYINIEFFHLSTVFAATVAIVSLALSVRRIRQQDYNNLARTTPMAWLGFWIILFTAFVIGIFVFRYVSIFI